MFHENKINSKNVWKLRMIDYLRLSVSSHIIQNFAQTSSALDVCAKVYGIKVDDTHADVLKFASHLGRTAHNSNDDGNDDEALDGEQHGARNKRVRRLPASAKNKIVKDPTSLVGNIIKLDTGIFQTHTASDTSSISNLFSYRMPLNHEGYKFMPFSDEKDFLSSDDEEDENQEDSQLSYPICFSSDEKGAFSSDDEEDENQEDPQLLYPIKIPTLTNFQICAALRNFKIDEVDPNEDPIEEGPANFNNEFAYDEEGIPVAELDGSLHNSFEDDAADLSSGDELEHQNIYAGRNEQVAQLQSFQPGQHNVRLTEYGFAIGPERNNNKFITQVWAGPSHWKLKCVRPAITRFSGRQEKQVRDAKAARQPRFQPEMIDFEADLPDLSQLGKVKRNSSFPFWKKYALPLTSLEETIHKDELFHKQVPVPFKNDVEEFIDGGEIGSYQYDNENDSNYCPEVQEVNNRSKGCDEFVDEHIQKELVQQDFLQNNFMDCPKVVQKSHIAYASYAKRVDMKKLKSIMWTCLSKEKDKNKIEKTMFSTVYKQLGKSLPQKMREDMSCSMAFFALLHLASEHNLIFTGQPDGKDFIIEQNKKGRMTSVKLVF